MRIPEHPEIARTIRTGHPHKTKSAQCTDCGREHFGDSEMFIYDGDLVCGKCLKARILANYSAADLAAALDIAGTTVSEHLEQEGEYGFL